VPEQAALLLDVREHEDFLGDRRDTEAAEIRARRFAQADSADTPFSEQEGREVADALKELKDVVKAADENRLKITEPHRDTVQHVNDQYKELLAKPRAAIEVLTKRGLATKRELDRREVEAERERREDLQRREEEAAAKAAEAARKAEADRKDSAAQEAAAEARRQAAQAAAASAQRSAGADAKPKQLRGSFASLGSVTTYKWDVFDLAALPDEHKIENKKSIDAEVKAEEALAKAQNREFNLHLIPGVRIWSEERGVSR
jgi:colicin import membrane protein